MPKINTRKLPQHFHRWYCRLLLIALPVTVFHACAPTKCILCDIDRSVLYNVELKDEAKLEIGKSKFQSFFAPVPIETGKDGVSVYLVDCDNQEPFKLQKEELEAFIQKNLYKFDTTQIKQIVTTSDADFPPVVVSYTTLDSFRLCNRNRNSMKYEIRGMIGSRPWSNEPTYFPGYDRGITYPRNDVWDGVMGFGPGGTNLIIGLEGAAMKRLKVFNNRNAFSLGLLSGFWPVDGGFFLPLSIHPRFTFNEIPAPLWGQCNAWYLFGDLGSAIDLGGQIPVFANKHITSWFTGLGAGIDLWRTRNLDLSFDAGYRYSSLGLPFNEDYQKCLEESGRESNITYPSRNVGQFFIRIGFTW